MSEHAFEHYEAELKAWEDRPDLGLNPIYPQHQTIAGELVAPIGASFEITGLHDSIAASRGMFLFHPRISESLGLSSFSVQEAIFTERKDWRFERGISEHEIFFGILELVADDPDHTFMTLPVACKPYGGDFSTSDAVHEYAAMEFVNDSGIIETFQPVGFWVDNEGNPFLLTEFEESVKSFDNIDWETTMDMPEEHLDVFSGLAYSAYTLAKWHTNGIVHRDAQFRNMAVDTHTAQLKAIDLERLRVVCNPSSEPTDELADLIRHDIKVLVTSVCDTGLLSSVSDPKEVIQEAFMTPYLSVVRHPAVEFSSRMGATTLEAVEMICEDISSNV